MMTEQQGRILNRMLKEKCDPNATVLAGAVTSLEQVKANLAIVVPKDGKTEDAVRRAVSLIEDAMAHALAAMVSNSEGAVTLTEDEMRTLTGVTKDGTGKAE